MVGILWTCYPLPKTPLGKLKCSFLTESLGCFWWKTCNQPFNTVTESRFLSSVLRNSQGEAEDLRWGVHLHPRETRLWSVLCTSILFPTGWDSQGRPSQIDSQALSWDSRNIQCHWHRQPSWAEFQGATGHLDILFIGPITTAWDENWSMNTVTKVCLLSQAMMSSPRHCCHSLSKLHRQSNVCSITLCSVIPFTKDLTHRR